MKSATASQPNPKPRWQPIAKSQIAAIKSLSKKAGQTREDYLAMLQGFGVATCTSLSYERAGELIAHLNRIMGNPETRPKPALPYSHLEGRASTFATPFQLRKISANWNMVTRQTTRKKKDAALDQFLRNRFQILGMQCVEATDVDRILYAIRAMRRRGERPQGDEVTE